jgi:hypothetical protein
VTPAAEIALLVLDVDGVLTDGRLWYGADGESLKAFDVRDGHGIKSLVAAGIGVAVISGRRSAAVTARMRELGVSDVAQGVGDKARALSRAPEARRDRCAPGRLPRRRYAGPRPDGRRRPACRGRGCASRRCWPPPAT